MGRTLTIRNLDEAVKQKLRVSAATSGRSMEAEAREILSRNMLEASPAKIAAKPAKQKFDHLVGIWKGQMSTDELMKELRG